MQCVTMFYPNKPGAIFDFEYYLRRHIPWARTLVPDLGTEVRRGISTPTDEAVPFICLCRFWIPSENEYRAAMENYGKQLITDLGNFTNIEPVVQIDEVVLDTELRAAA
jgi:uncharacterized protein (TIGR02118 family)